MSNLVNAKVISSDNPPAQSVQIPDTLPTDGFIRIMPLSRLIGIHHQTLRRWWKEGKFPRPQNRNGILLFKNTDVKQWADNQPNIIG